MNISKAILGQQLDKQSYHRRVVTARATAITVGSDVLQLIFKYLEILDLFQARHVCKTWNKISYLQYSMSTQCVSYIKNVHKLFPYIKYIYSSASWNVIKHLQFLPYLQFLYLDCTSRTVLNRVIWKYLPILQTLHIYIKDVDLHSYFLTLNECHNLTELSIHVIKTELTSPLSNLLISPLPNLKTLKLSPNTSADILDIILKDVCTSVTCQLRNLDNSDYELNVNLYPSLALRCPYLEIISCHYCLYLSELERFKELRGIYFFNVDTFTYLDQILQYSTFFQLQTIEIQIKPDAFTSELYMPTITLEHVREFIYSGPVFKYDLVKYDNDNSSQRKQITHLEKICITEMYTQTNVDKHFTVEWFLTLQTHSPYLKQWIINCSLIQDIKELPTLAPLLQHKKVKNNKI
jgi:hypothetical protein